MDSQDWESNFKYIVQIWVNYIYLYYCKTEVIVQFGTPFSSQRHLKENTFREYLTFLSLILNTSLFSYVVFLDQNLKYKDVITSFWRLAWQCSFIVIKNTVALSFIKKKIRPHHLLLLQHLPPPPGLTE